MAAENITPQPEIRKLTSVLNQQGDSAPREPAQLVKLARPASGNRLLLPDLGSNPALGGSDGPYIIPANPLRVSLMIFNLNAGTNIIWVGGDENNRSSPSGSDGIPLFAGGSLTLEVTGEVFMNASSPTRFFFVEIVADVQQ